jgi:N-acetylglucosaminyl-diphospho-decaprenol L-rhamnosyltransferase
MNDLTSNTEKQKERPAGVRWSVLVIIVNYKSAALTLQSVATLEHERAAQGLDLRVVVVENQSGDAEALRAGLAQRAGWVDLILAEKNGGFAYGNNIGFRHAYETGFVPDFFYLLNPDTRVYPGAITRLCEFMDANPEVGIAGSSLENDDGSDWPIAFRFPTLQSEVDSAIGLGVVTRLLERWSVAKRMGKTPEQVDWLPGASMLVRREAVEAIGGLDEEYFLYYEETDFCLKAKRAGFSCWYVPDSRVVHITGQSTGVTNEATKPRRFPAYWFESRRRFFLKNHGVGYAAATDVAFALASGLGCVKALLKRENAKERATFMLDVLRFSPLFGKNRALKSEKSFEPPPARA